MNRKLVLATLIAASLGSAAAAAPFSSAVNLYSSFLLTTEGGSLTPDQQTAIDTAQTYLDSRTSTKFSTDWSNLAKADAALSKLFPGDAGFQQAGNSAIAAVALLGGGALPGQANLAATSAGSPLTTAGIIVKVGKLAARTSLDGNGTGFETTDVAANRKKFFKSSLSLFKYCESIIKRYGN